MVMVTTEIKHISINDDGIAIVSGTPFTVNQIAHDIQENGWTAEDFCRNHRGEITLAQTYAALFYYDNLDIGSANRENILQTIDSHRDELQRIGVKRLGVFGSCARHEADAASDIDIL